MNKSKIFLAIIKCKSPNYQKKPCNKSFIGSSNSFLTPLKLENHVSSPIIYSAFVDPNLEYINYVSNL